MRQMKNSGIEWIGEIPADWNVMPHKYIMHKEKSICERYNGEDIISLTMNGVIIRDLTAGGKMPTTFDGYQYVEPDDLLLCLFDIDVTPRCVGIVRNKGITSPAYSRFKVHKGYHNAYYDYLLRFIDDEKVFVHLSKNLRSSLTETDFGSILTVVPPLGEQKKIASFLDQKCAEIDAVIEKTKETIEEYKKLKQSVITEAVTKGIRGNRPMKDSGIEWIGEIPVEWNTIRLKNVAHSFVKGNGITKEDTIENGDTPCVRYGEIYTKYNQGFSKCITRTNLSIINSPKYFSNGDILFTCTGELVEEIGKSIVYLGEENCLAGGDIIVLKHSQYPSFLNYALNSSYAQAQKSCNKTKLKVVHISASDISNIVVTLPSLEEQEVIASYLDQKCAEIDTLIEKKTNLLTELENYKKSLIYEHVTGKKEVSEVSDNTTVAIVYPCFPAVLSTKKARFAQSVLVSKILDSNVKYMGRVKLEKMLFTIEHSLGFNFDTEYARQKAGPLDDSIYECEKIISRTNKWFYVNNSQYGTSYKPQKNMGKYKRYYEQYFSDYNEEIESIISVFENYSLQQSEIVATLFAAWNDAIIDKKQFTDEDVVNDVLNNWHESKTRFSKDVWLRAMDEMRKNNLIPKGYGKKTVIKN